MKWFRHLGFLALPVLVVGYWQSTNVAQGATGPSFTRDQASAGRAAYRESCAVCHGAKLEGIHLSPSLVGDRFDQTWRGKSADVLSFHIRRMPPEGAEGHGTVNDETYTNILAYILISNDFEASDEALPIEMASLGKVKIPQKEGYNFDPDAPVDATPEQKSLLANLPPVTDAMLSNPPEKDWLRWGRSSNGHSFSPLTQINKDSVSGLKPAWRAPLRPGSSMSAPIIHEGVMFLQTFPDTVLAMDATNGQVLWRYQYDIKGRSSSKMGLAIYGDRLFVPTSDQHVISLNAKTGALIWDHEIDMRSTGTGLGGYNLRTTPFIVKDKVIMGVTASFMPKGGFIFALDVDTGEEEWRFNTIARPGDFGGNTWNDLPMDKRSGGSVWHQATYDADLDLLYFGVAPTYDTGPMLYSVDKEGVTNDGLYTNCTIAVDPDTGELVWYYQHVANDQWDLDWAFERQIVNVNFKGEMRKAVMNIGKICILEALDAKTGEYLFSVDTGIQNFITAIDPVTGEKTIDPDKMPSIERPCTVCPSASGARCWPPTSFSPQSNMVYVPITESCMVLGKEGMRLLTSGVGITSIEHPDSKDGMLGRLQAIDVANQKLAWTHHQVAPITTGVLTTGGGLVFSGDLSPSLNAFDDKTGELLWQAQLDGRPTSALTTYSVGGTQYIAVTVGMNNLHVDGLNGAFMAFAAKNGIAVNKPPKGGPALWVFALQQ